MRRSKNLAELVGIILGDGSFYVDKEHYQLDISFNLKDEMEYCDFVKKLLENIAKNKSYIKYDKEGNCIHLRLNRKKDVLCLLEFSLVVPGNKVKNNVTIPMWIFKNREYLKCCMRGLIDTDGSIFRMSKRDYNLTRIEFKNMNKRLLKDVEKSFVLLGFHTSKVICNREIFLSRQDEVKRYIKEIGFNNPKNRKRIDVISPLV
jgi:hypothetical protein